jgi:hypothetical protein
MAADDFSASVKLTAGPVNNSGTIAITGLPGVGADTTIDQAKTEVSVNGSVYVAPAVQVAFGADFINVINRTGAPWPQHSDVYVYAPRLPPADQAAEIDALNTKVTTLEGQVGALQTTVAGHTTQITALQTTVADHTTRIAALEAAAS